MSTQLSDKKTQNCKSAIPHHPHTQHPHSLFLQHHPLLFILYNKIKQHWSCSTCAQPAVISHQHNTTLYLSLPCLIWPFFHVVPLFPLTMFFYYYYGAVPCGTHMLRAKRGVFLVRSPITTESVGTAHVTLLSLTMSHATQHISFCSLSFTQKHILQTYTTTHTKT